MEQYIIPAAAAVIVAIIEAIAARERKRNKRDREDAAEKEAQDRSLREEKYQANEQLLVMLIQTSWASIALSEATAHALQRGHTNGDMEAALEYATKVKHEQKEFLTKLGIHSILE